MSKPTYFSFEPSTPATIMCLGHPSTRREPSRRRDSDVVISIRTRREWLTGVLVLFLVLLAFPARADFEAGAGVAAGGAACRGTVDAHREFDFAASPLLAAKWDPIDASLRPTFGIASLPTYSYSMGYDASTTPLLVGELGLAYGSAHHRIALVGHAGLLSFGAGLHYTLLPIKLGGGVRMGPEVRAMWMAREAGYVGIVWTFRFGASQLRPHGTTQM